jgi:hypothetical protein
VPAPVVAATATTMFSEAHSLPLIAFFGSAVVVLNWFVPA